MTLVALSVAALLCLAGTRLAAAAFTVAAVLAAGGDPLSGLAATWAAATAACLVLCGSPPRRLALPALGLAATLVAARAPNAAAVLPAWTIGAVCVAASVARTQAERRWATLAMAADLPFVAAVCLLVLRTGFTAWPPRGPGVCGLMLLASAARVPLAAGAPRSARGSAETGAVLVRAQAVVLLSLAVGGSREVAWAAAVAGPAVFALGSLSPKDRTRDFLQEAGLVAAALAGTALGWVPAGWAWGALAAGTLLHVMRAADRPQMQWARSMRDVVRDGWIGSPLLPVAAAIGYGALTGSARIGAFTAVALVTGLALRPGLGSDGRRSSDGVSAAATGGLATAGLVMGLWAGVATFPAPVAARPAPWPGSWAVFLVLAGAAAGARVSWLTAPPRSRVAPALVPTVAVRSVVPPAEKIPAAAVLAVSGGVGVAVFIVGLLRGFL